MLTELPNIKLNVNLFSGSRVKSTCERTDRQYKANRRTFIQLCCERA
jgi:hypothetical protein